MLGSFDVYIVKVEFSWMNQGEIMFVVRLFVGDVDGGQYFKNVVNFFDVGDIVQYGMVFVDEIGVQQCDGCVFGGLYFDRV